MSLATQSPENQFSVCGQLQLEDIATVAQRGFRSIINNRPDGEAAPTEQPNSSALASAAAAANLTYVHLPVVSGQLTEAQIKEMAHLLKTLPSPILAFCRSGTRSKALFDLAQALLQKPAQEKTE